MLNSLGKTGSLLRTCAAAAAMTSWATGAWSGAASFDIPITTAVVSGGATTSAGGIVLPDTGTPGFVVGFILPRDYLKNRLVRIVMYFAANTAPCAARIEPVSMTRRRIGLLTVVSLDGLAAAGNDPVVNFTNAAVTGLTFTLRRGASLGGLFPDHRNGDSFTIAFRRNTASGTDTCNGAILLPAINVIYPVP